MQIRGNFSDFFFEDALPALRAVIMDEYEQYQELYSRIMNVQTSDRSIEQTTQVSGVGLLTAIGETESINMDRPVQGFDKTYKHVKYGLAVPTSQEMIEDDKFGLVQNAHRSLARSTRETIEILAAGIFNNAFSGSHLGPDGVALCSASHPLVKSGGTQSNVGTSADLSYTSFQLALTDFETMRDSAGLLHRVPVKTLMVAPANRWIAAELLRSGDRPDTANRATNTLKYAIDGLPEMLVHPYLTDDDTWFLLAPPNRTQVHWFWRKRPTTSAWFDDAREVGYNAIRFRQSHGWSDFNGVYGVQGV